MLGKVKGDGRWVVKGRNNLKNDTGHHTATPPSMHAYLSLLFLGATRLHTPSQVDKEGPEGLKGTVGVRSIGKHAITQEG